MLLAAQLSSKEVGANGVLTGPGISLEVPIFNRNQGLIARADAEVEIASLQYLALKQRVALEVAEAREQLVQAQDVLRKLRDEVLPPLQRAGALAEDQYKKGEVAYLFVLEQTRGLIDAQLRIVDAEAAIRRAQAQLERSVGSR
jgi:cobalt-zinc-cadmium efflux system outer membrane protein